MKSKTEIIKSLMSSLSAVMDRLQTNAPEEYYSSDIIAEAEDVYKEAEEILDEVDSGFNINYFELLFLAEVCVPPKPIARTMFFMDLCDKHYHKLNYKQREQMYHVLLPMLNDGDGYCENFRSRFNPDNQYVVTTDYLGVVEAHNAYLHEDRYHTAMDTWIGDEYIKSIKKAG